MSVNTIGYNASAQTAFKPRAQIGQDLNSILSDLQRNQATPGTSSAVSSSTSSAGTVGLSNDLRSFFTDLQTTGVGHHGHHGQTKRPDDAGNGVGSGGVAASSASSNNDRLSGIVKALQAYGARLAPPASLSTAT